MVSWKKNRVRHLFIGKFWKLNCFIFSLLSHYLYKYFKFLINRFIICEFDVFLQGIVMGKPSSTSISVSWKIRFCVHFCCLFTNLQVCNFDIIVSMWSFGKWRTCFNCVKLITGTVNHKNLLFYNLIMGNIGFCLFGFLTKASKNVNIHIVFVVFTSLLLSHSYS